MKKSILYFILFFLYSVCGKGQNTIYDFVKLGNFQVGYQDTLVFDTTYRYEAYGYKGAKPQFIQLWYPLTSESANPTFLSFNDFFETGTDDGLSAVRSQLNKHFQEAIVRDCLEENLITGNANTFGTHSYSDVLSLIGSIKTKSTLKRNFKKSQYPVIIYHHGSQSFSFENYLMAEYFASRGFIFIGTNFHLPYENMQFGLKPFDKIVKNEEEGSLKNSVEYAQSLSSNSSVFFIGHSWGAQMGLRALDNNTTIKGLISLESTIEFKEDYKEIEEFWPEVYHKIAIEKTQYHFPILFCAATGQEKPFMFFQNLNVPHCTFASTKEQFEHNAYTSVFYLRYFIDSEVKQTDKEVVLDRLQLYVNHLELMNDFIGRILKNEIKQGTELTFVK